MKAQDLRIVFMGTPGFAVGTLEALIKNKMNVVAVITAPDKPAGRGRHLTASEVKQCAMNHSIPVLQPLNLKDQDFINELASFKADLQIVVAFRMLPEVVWNMPPRGTFNLHASLLPQYRGAAPINRAIMNGETYTGITTFFLEKQIDTGNIIFSERVNIGEDMNAGQLHDVLMEKGAELVIRTVNAIAEGSIKPVKQEELITDELKDAPKIFKEDCKINWTESLNNIYNQVRGLSPYPAAFTSLKCDDETIDMKIFQAKKVFESNPVSGSIITDNKSFLKIGCADGYLDIAELQLAGKKRMRTSDFLLGFKFKENCQAD